MGKMGIRRIVWIGGSLFLWVLLVGGDSYCQPAADPGSGSGLDAVVPIFQCDQMPINEALQMLSKFASIDIITSKGVGTIPVNASLTNMTVRQILDTLLKQYGLVWKQDATTGVVTVMTAQEEIAQRTPPKLITRTFEIKYAPFQSITSVIQQKRSPNGAQYHIPGQNKIIVTDLPSVIADIEKTIQELDTQTVTVQIPLNYINAGEAQQQIQPLLSDAPGTIQLDKVRNVIVIRDTPERIREAQEVLQMLDQPREIRVFEIQYADPDEIISMIQSMNILSEQAQIQAHLGTNKIIIQDIPARVEQAAKIIATLDEPPLQILIEAEIVEMRLDDQLELGVNYEWGKDVSPTSVGSGTTSVETGLNLLVEFVNGNLDVSDYTKLFGTNFKYALNAAKALNLAETVASPFGRVRNHETFDFQDGSEEPYEVRQQQRTSTGVTTGDIYTQRTRSVGRILTVTPHANSAGMITLDIAVEDSSARDKKGTGGNILLAVDKKSMVTYLDVIDGHTVAIGGIIEHANTKGKTGVPILMDIPLLGRAFRTERKTSIKRKLLIFITPHIEKLGGPKEEEESVNLGLGKENLGNLFDWTPEDAGVSTGIPGEGIDMGTVPEEGAIRYGPDTTSSGEVLEPSEATIPSGTTEQAM